MNNLQVKGRTLKRLIEAAETERKDFIATGKEVEAFAHKADEKVVYDGLGLQAELWFRTTVALTAEAIDLMCPYLYPTNPYRCGKVRRHPFSPPGVHELASARNELMETYLNYTPEETDLYGESVRAINQSQVYGAGVLWTGFNERKGLVQSSYDNIENLFIDPDATTWSEVNWVARKRENSRWKLMEKFPAAKQIIAALQPAKNSKSNIGKPSDLIVYYEVHMRVGLHHYIEGGLRTVDEMGNPIEFTDAPRRFIVSDDGKVLGEATWEIPFFMDDMWPCEIVSYIDDKDSIWPISPMRPGLPFQKALNWLYIFYMTKIRFCSRSLFAVMDYADTDVPADAKKALESWNDMPFLNVRTQDSQRKISEIFQQLNLDPKLDDFERAHAIIKREFQEHTGVYDILHYGEGDTQDRSATATQFKEKTSKTRINYRIDRVIKWQSRLARKEAMAARFLHTPEQIDVILGQGAGQIWGQIMPPDPTGGNGMEVNFQQWFLETDYSIVSTSMRRHDYDTKVDALKEMMNQTVPTQLQSADPNERAMAYDTMAEYYEAIGASDNLILQQREMAKSLRAQAMMPPAPMVDPATGQPLPPDAGMAPGMPPSPMGAGAALPAPITSAPGNPNLDQLIPILMAMKGDQSAPVINIAPPDINVVLPPVNVPPIQVPPIHITPSPTRHKPVLAVPQADGSVLLTEMDTGESEMSGNAEVEPMDLSGGDGSHTMMTMEKITEMLGMAKNAPPVVNIAPPDINVVVNMPARGKVIAKQQDDGSVVMEEQNDEEKNEEDTE